MILDILKKYDNGRNDSMARNLISSILVMYRNIEKMLHNKLTYESIKLAYTAVISTYEKNKYFEIITINYRLEK